MRVVIGSPFDDVVRFGQGRGGRFVDDHIAPLGHVLGAGQSLEGFTGHHIDVLDRRVADEEPNHRTHSYRDLHGERDLTHAGENDSGELLHDRLYRNCARRGPLRRSWSGGVRCVDPSPIARLIEPTRDRIAAERKNAAAVIVDLRHKSVVNTIQVNG